MKILLSIAPILFLMAAVKFNPPTSTLMMNTTGEDDTVLLENHDVVYYVITKKDLSEFVKVEYIKSAKDIYIQTLREISFLEVADLDGHPLYKLPIDTKKIHLATSDLKGGKYAIKLRIKGENKYIQTILKKT